MNADKANERRLVSTRLAIESVFANLKGSDTAQKQHLAKTPGGLALRIAQRPACASHRRSGSDWSSGVRLVYLAAADPVVRVGPALGIAFARF